MNLFFISLSQNVFAARTIGDALSNAGEVTTFAGVETTNVESLSAEIIKSALGLVGLLFFILMVYGGFLWMTARGDEAQVEKAKGTVRAAVIGLAIVVASYAVTALIVNRLAVQGNGQGGNAGCADRRSSICIGQETSAACIGNPETSQMCVWRSGTCIQKVSCYLKNKEECAAPEAIPYCEWNGD